MENIMCGEDGLLMREKWQLIYENRWEYFTENVSKQSFGFFNENDNALAGRRARICKLNKVCCIHNTLSTPFTL
jgi:hypothetical protein